MDEVDARRKAAQYIARNLSSVAINGKSQAIDLMSCVRLFHKTYGQGVNDVPTHMDSATAILRKRLFQEEHNEYIEHINQYIDHIDNFTFADREFQLEHDNLFAAIVDDIVDSIFVLIGDLVSMGVNLPEVFGEVFLSNMSKLDEEGKPIIRADGKVLKGPGYFKPDLARTIGKITRHTCHWPGCEKAVPPRMWGCREHWFALPKKYRDKINKAYIPGQEITKTPSKKYLEVAQEVRDYILDNYRFTPYD